MTPAEIKAEISEANEEALFADGFDDCLCGVLHSFGRPPVALYDLDAMISKLVREGLTEDEAYEHWSFNIVGAWMGEGTPVYARILAAPAHTEQSDG